MPTKNVSWAEECESIIQAFANKSTAVQERTFQQVLQQLSDVVISHLLRKKSLTQHPWPMWSLITRGVLEVCAADEFVANNQPGWNNACHDPARHLRKFVYTMEQSLSQRVVFAETVAGRVLQLNVEHEHLFHLRGDEKHELPDKTLKLMSLLR